MKRGGGRKSNPWFNVGAGSRFQPQKEKPLFTVARNHQNSDSDESPGNFEAPPPSNSDVTFSTDREPGSYIGWKLYFPLISFKDSPDILRRITAMEKHFTNKDFMHWYSKGEIEENCILPLSLDYIRSDPNIQLEWPNIFEDLSTKSTQSLACIALAMHNTIVKGYAAGSHEAFQHQKIFTRPIGALNHLTKLSAANQTNGEMITVTGTVVHEEPVTIACKMVCFRCAMCSTELVVKQNPGSSQYVYPTSCRRGCPARGRFVEQLSSPFTMYQPKQMIRLQESMYVENQEHKTLDVELIHDLVDCLVLGSVVTVTGVVKHNVSSKGKKFVKKGEGKLFKPYLKCFSIEIHDNADSQNPDGMTVDDREFIELTKAQPSPFRLLVHSLCPSIYGREEAKAGLILALLSGSDLLKKRRSESHILLVGNPGAGKSKLLQACAEVSTKGIFVSGPTSTAVGLTASVGKSGVMDAGALVLANGGCCCIDEFDKMSSHAHILLESMEQQIISITKCGVRVNLPSNVVILAAANPTGSFYDNSKTLSENVRITSPLLSRFDLIYPLSDQDKSTDAEFMNHLSKKPTMMGNQSRGFFTPQRVISKDKIGWLKLQPGENLDLMPLPLLQKYIGNARENVFPTLSTEAKAEIRAFFLQLRELTVGIESQTVSFRQLEALMRLTLARARADMAEVALKEHAVDVINLFKYTMSDIFADMEITDGVTGGLRIKKSQIQNCSSMSKPKQQKAFIDYVRDLEQEEFSTAELKNIAKELGIRDFYEIIEKLNFSGEILKTVDGYKIVDL